MNCGLVAKTPDPFELAQDGNDVYIWSPDGHLIQGKGLYVQYDAQGSTTALVNAAGKVTERFVYDENGQAFALGGSPRNPQSPLAQGATPKNWPFGYQQQRSMQFVSISGISSGGLSAARSDVSVALNMNAAGVWTNPVNGVHLSSLISTFSGAAQPPSMFSQVVMVAAPMVVGVTVAIVATPFLTPLGGAALGGLAGGLTAGLLGGMAAGDTDWQLAGDVAAGGAIGLIGGAVGGAVFELAAPLAGSILGSTGGGAAAGVVSGLAGDFAGQGLAIGMGMQNGYNYTQLAFSGFAGGAFGAYAGFRDPTLGGLLEAPSELPGMAVRYEPPANVVSFSGEWEAELNQAVANRMSAVGVPDEMIGIQGMPYEDTGAFVRTHAIGGANNNIPGTGIIGSGPGINVDMAVLDQEFSGMSQVEAWGRAHFGIALTQLSPTNTLRFYMGLTMQQYNLHLRHLSTFPRVRD